MIGRGEIQRSTSLRLGAEPIWKGQRWMKNFIKGGMRYLGCLSRLPGRNLFKIFTVDINWVHSATYLNYKWSVQVAVKSGQVLISTIYVWEWVAIVAVVWFFPGLNLKTDWTISPWLTDGRMSMRSWLSLLEFNGHNAIIYYSNFVRQFLKILLNFCSDTIL